MNYEKKFFYCVAVATILVLSGNKVYHLCKDKNIFNIFSSASEKKLSMDYFYGNEFEQIYEKHWLTTPQLMAPEHRMERGNTFDAKIAELERKMIKDGYSNTEAGNIRHRAMQRIKAKWKLNWI